MLDGLNIKAPVPSSDRKLLREICLFLVFFILVELAEEVTIFVLESPMFSDQFHHGLDELGAVHFVSILIGRTQRRLIVAIHLVRSPQGQFV
jgi:hypothetical protein